MAYVQGFVASVTPANKDAYLRHAQGAASLFKEFGSTRQVEGWGDDVPDGKVTDFKGAVNAEGDEVVVFAWLEYPDKATCDAANAKLMSDPRMDELGEMPFDGKRMIYGGFQPIVDDGSGKGGYFDGYLVPVPEANREAYRNVATKASEVFRDHGALRVVEAWGDDVPEGKVTDYRRAVKAEDGENVVFSWVEWPSKQVRDEAWPKVMADERMKPDQYTMPFDGKRMIYGGFMPLLDV